MLPDTAHELGIATKPARIYAYRGEPYPRMISIASTLIQRGRGTPASVSPQMSLTSSVRTTSASVSRLEEKCLSKRKTTRVPRSASGKAEFGERFEEQGEEGGVVIRLRARNLNAVNMRVIRGQLLAHGSRMGEGGETHLTEEFVFVREYALDQLES